MGERSMRHSSSVLTKFRHKFIFTNMLFVLIVLAVVFAVVSIVNFNQRVQDIYDALDHRIAIVQDSDGHIASADGMQVPFANTQNGKLKDIAKRESGGDQFIATSSYIVSNDGTVQTVFDDSLSLDSDTLASTIGTALQEESQANGKDVRDHISALNLYYQVKNVGDGYIVALSSGNYVDQSMLSLDATLAVVNLAALAAFFFISLFLARWALRPVERAWEQQQQFVADASHELKTPLTVIMANNSILMSQPEVTVESQMQWIESTEIETHLMQGLVNDMLYLAQPESSDRSVCCSSANFSDIVQSSVLQFESVAFERGIAIDDSVEGGIFVEGDASRLQRMVSTLMDNACKYVDESGHVSVSLDRIGSTCRLSVANTGPVIDADDLPHLFDRFYRTDKARTRGEGGFGLGLSIAKSVVDEHGGSISAQSSLEKGTVFTVSLPLEGE
jgi:two-component system sensor histidine kinase CiaH